MMGELWIITGVLGFGIAVGRGELKDVPSWKGVLIFFFVSLLGPFSLGMEIGSIAQKFIDVLEKKDPGEDIQ